MSIGHRPCLVILSLSCTSALLAQTGQTTTSAVPRFVRVDSTFLPASGSAASPVESATFSIYSAEAGGSPLWQETQNVRIDSNGRYSLLLGSTRTEGLPVELFASGEPRWLGVQFQRAGEMEQPRVLLASVPYALKAADAETLGGQPLSAFVLANPATGWAAATPGSTIVSTAFKAPAPRISSGTPGYIGQFVNTTDLGNSVMYQNAGKIGLGTTNPLDYMHVVFTDTGGGVTGYAVQNLGNTATSYSGMLFYDQNGALGQFQGFNNSTHEYRINNIAKTGGAFDGSINFMIGSSSKLKVNTTGDVDIPGSILKNGTFFLHDFGPHNTALGVNALAPTFTGTDNTALGYDALFLISSGSQNTAVGSGALQNNNIGFDNNAVGYSALNANTSGGANNAHGSSALLSNTTGSANNALGDTALFFNNGNSNTAIGHVALFHNTTGSNNIAIGAQGGVHLTTGDNNIDIGNEGNAGESGTIRIGVEGTQASAFIAGVYGGVIGGTNAQVFVDNNGQLGTTSSSRRYKTDIQDMNDASQGLMNLRPVTFHYKAHPLDRLEYGLIAEEVAEIYPDLVIRNKDGEVESVQYHKLTPMLLNELQKEHRLNALQDETIRELEDKNRQLENRLAALEALLLNKGTTTATTGQ